MAVNNTEKFASIKNLQSVHSGDLISAGPWIGVIKNNIDYSRNGRLQVYIPSLGSVNPEDPNGWVICQYLSPFMGFTNMNASEEGKRYDKTQQSYGFWMVPPDIGVRVMIIFAEHDINKAYWIGCIPEPLKNHMVPSIGSRSYNDQNGSVVNFGAEYQSDLMIPAFQESLTQWFTENPSDLEGIKFPVGEVQFKTQNQDGAGNGEESVMETFYGSTRGIHEDLYKQFIVQGIQNDKDRGPITSSAQRDTPSQVFGFSTPGRTRKDIAQDATLVRKLKAGTAESDEVKDYVNKGNKARRGGHSLTMDDGDVAGQNNLVRIRSSRGHQITMHDTEEFIHIQHANGLAWIEIDAVGQITIFSNNSLNIRTGLDLNLRADNNINLEAGNEVNIRGKNKIKTETTDMYMKSLKTTRMHQGEDFTMLTDGSIALNSTTSSGWNCAATLNYQGSTINLNSGPAPSSPVVEKLPKEKYTDVVNSDGVIWQEEKEPSIESILNLIPTHEPYPRRIKPKTPEQIARFYRNLL